MQDSVFHKSRKSSQNFNLPKIPKSIASSPRYLQVQGYKDYKYKSYMLDLMKEDKRLQNQLPYHLQNLPKKIRKRYELNDSTRNELLHNSRLDNIFTDTESEVPRSSAITQGGNVIFNNYNKVLKSFQQESFISNRESSQICEEISINNTIITNIIEHQKLLTTNPRLVRKQKEHYKEMNTIKEFKLLVDSTKQYLEMQGLPTHMPKLYLMQFILRDSYNSFRELSQLIQDRLLLVFDINPHNDEDKVFYEQFSKFKQIIISQSYKTHELIDFFVKFFNPQRNERISVTDIRAILSIILDGEIDQLVKYFMKNLLVSQYIEENYIYDLKGVFQSNTIDPNHLIQLLLKNI